MIELFETRLVAPERLAIVGNDLELTYGELTVEVDQLAARLRDLGAGRGRRVGIATDRSAETVIAILATLTTGASYVPLDPAYPPERLRFLVEDSRCSVVVTRRHVDLAWVPESVQLHTLQRVSIGSDAQEPLLRDSPGHDRPVSEDEAYVIYTSGSTGQPKGCSVSHGNVLSLLNAALPFFDVGESDRWTLFHSSSFDFSVWEMWGAFATGATLVIVDLASATDPQMFVELCRERDVTVLCAVPSVFHGLVTQFDPTLPLRYVIFGGEQMRPEDVRLAHDLMQGRTRFVNMYGITESTVHVTFKELGPSDLQEPMQHSPIGMELPHLSVVIADESGRPVPDGMDGEMLISGAGVALGYVGQPELTAERFLTIDGLRMYRSGDLGRRLPNGELAYRGRADDQVKVRGFRIELGEIETVTRAHPLVRDACAAVVTGIAGTTHLEAAVVAEPGLVVEELRSYLRSSMPSHMVPSRIRLLPDIPRLVSGKPDRRTLLDILTDAGSPASAADGSFPCESASEAPNTAQLLEGFLTEVWTSVLGHDDFDANDDFFGVGGDSLSIVVIRERLNERFPILEVDLVDLFEHPSVHDLAMHLASSPGAGRIA